MKTTMTIQARSFPVRLKDQRTSEERDDVIVLDKTTLQAAQIVGESSKELIYRLYNREGFDVMDIGKATKREIRLNLEEVFRLHSMTMKREGCGS